MKHIIFKAAIFSSLLAFSSESFAQSADKNNKTSIRIQVTEDAEGKVRHIEKNYAVPEMSEPERKQFVDKVLDSLGVEPKNQRSLSVTIDDGNGPTTTVRKRRKAVIDHPDEREPTAFSWNDDFSENFDTEKLRSHMRNFERDFRPKAKMMMRDMENFGDRVGDWTKEVIKSSTVHGLNVYANNPDNGMLNLRFQTAQKGDVNISITDTKGKEVGRKEIKDFTGDFVGQVEIRKNTKGTLFVTVVQNEDGATKRVVLP